MLLLPINKLDKFNNVCISIIKLENGTHIYTKPYGIFRASDNEVILILTILIPFMNSNIKKDIIIRLHINSKTILCLYLNALVKTSIEIWDFSQKAILAPINTTHICKNIETSVLQNKAF